MLLNRSVEREIEWDCARVICQYYQHVDRNEFDKAVLLYTPKVRWEVMGVRLIGRGALQKGLVGALTGATIRHIVTNTVVNVLNVNHADVRFYLSIYYEEDTRVEDHDGPIQFLGPHRIMDQGDKMILTDNGWRTSHRWGKTVFRRDIEKPIGLEIWAGGR